jgi:hypothetical protein
MTRLIGPSNADRLAYTIVMTSGSMKGVLKGKPLAEATFYNDLDPTAEPTLEMLTSPADIRTLAGAVIPDSTVTINSVSQFPLVQFPDGDPVGPDSLLVQIGSGPPYRTYARDDDRIDALVAALDAALARIAGLEFPWLLDGDVLIANAARAGLATDENVLIVDTLATAGVTVDGDVLVVNF